MVGITYVYWWKQRIVVRRFAQEKSAQDRARVEIDRISAERDKEKEEQNAKIVSD